MKRLKFLLILVAFANIFCNNSTSPLDSFFRDVEQKAGQKNILAFKNVTREDSVIIELNKFSDEFNSVYEDSSYLEGISAFLKTNNAIEHLNDRGKCGLILIFALHSKLNNKTISIEKILKNIKNLYELRRIYNLQIKEKHYQENLKIVQQNNEKWNNGDTICFIFPVYKYSDGTKNAFNYQYPATLDYSVADDSLSIKGILVEKFYDDFNSNQIDSINLIFKTKIIELNDFKTLILLKKYDIGDELYVNLGDYGRLIKLE